MDVFIGHQLWIEAAKNMQDKTCRKNKGYIVLSLESLHANVKFLKAIEEKKAKLKSKREEVERKARRGEIDPMHEHAIQNISQVRATLSFQRFDIFETSF